jgi:hypothetical protein
VPIQSFVPPGQTGAGVIGQERCCADEQSGWQVKCAQQSEE